jgi:hypothetical protein
MAALSHAHREDLADAAVYIDTFAGRKWVCHLCSVRVRNEDGKQHPLSVVGVYLCEPCAEAIGTAITRRTLEKP